MECAKLALATRMHAQSCFSVRSRTQHTQRSMPVHLSANCVCLAEASQAPMSCRLQHLQAAKCSIIIIITIIIVITNNPYSDWLQIILYLSQIGLLNWRDLSSVKHYCWTRMATDSLLVYIPQLLSFKPTTEEAKIGYHARRRRCLFSVVGEQLNTAGSSKVCPSYVQTSSQDREARRVLLASARTGSARWPQLEA